MSNNLRYPKTTNLESVFQAMVKDEPRLAGFEGFLCDPYLSMAATLAWALRDRVLTCSTLRLGIVSGDGFGDEDLEVLPSCLSLVTRMLKLPACVKKVQIVVAVDSDSYIQAMGHESRVCQVKGQNGIPIEVVISSGPLHKFIFNDHFRGCDSVYFANAHLHSAEIDGEKKGVAIDRAFPRLQQIGINVFGTCDHPDKLVGEVALLKALGLDVTSSTAPYVDSFAICLPPGSPIYQPNGYFWQVAPTETPQDRHLNFSEWAVFVSGDTSAKRIMAHCRQVMPDNAFMLTPELVAKCVADSPDLSAAYGTLKLQHDAYLAQPLP